MGTCLNREEHGSTPAYIPAGKSGDPELIWYPGKESGKAFKDIDLAQVDVIIGGPHSSAIYAAELKPFISKDLSRRKQFDFSDVATAAVGRAWVQADYGNVVFVENPHSRLLFDPNRQSMALHNAEFEEFKQMKAYSPVKPSGEAWSFFKASTFGGAAVLDAAKLQGCSEATFNQLVAAMTAAKEGPEKYEACLNHVVSAVCEAKKKLSAASKSLDVISLHDTMNTKCNDNGSITKERPAEDLLPLLASFDGPMVGTKDAGTNLNPCEGNRIHKVATAWAQAFATKKGEAISASKEVKEAALRKYEPDDDIKFCVPYNGANESKQTYAACSEGLDLYVYQVEFNREVIVGPEATGVLKAPGTNWPVVDAAHVESVAKKLASAGALLRTN